MVERLIKFFQNWRRQRREALEREYEYLARTIAQCQEENLTCRTRLMTDNSGAASALASIRDNNETIAYLSLQRQRLANKLGYA